MELKEKLEKFVYLINILNEVEDVEFLYMALIGSKFGKNFIFNQSNKEITIEIPKYVYKEVEKPVPWVPYYYDTYTDKISKDFNKMICTNETHN